MFKINLKSNHFRNTSSDRGKLKIKSYYFPIPNTNLFVYFARKFNQYHIRNKN